MSPQYRINELFQTLQGEAAFTGTPAVFVRLQGCPVGCPWCDTKHTWDSEPGDEISLDAMLAKASDSPTHARATAEQLAELIRPMPERHIVLTGGEPCLYDLRPLCDALFQDGRRVQIETSATHSIRAPDGVWVTVSPKIAMPGGFAVRADALLRADEIKHPVGKQRDVNHLLELLEEHDVLDVEPDRRPLIWLQPLSRSRKATEVCIEAARRHGWRVSIQTHKFMGLR